MDVRPRPPFPSLKTNLVLPSYAVHKSLNSESEVTEARIIQRPFITSKLWYENPVELEAMAERFHHRPKNPKKIVS
jgi:hypothetical protein